MKRMKVNVAILSFSQACLYTANSILIASAALVGTALASNPMYATAPVAMIFLFGMGFAMPASLLMKVIGRRLGFQIGLVFSAGGACLAGYAIILQAFIVFCIAIALIGIGNAFAGFYRFAAADVADETYRSRAISLVLAGSVAAAFIGPNLANLTKDTVSGHLFAGSYWALAAVYLLSLVVMSFLKVPPASEKKMTQKGRALSEILVQPRFIVALASAMVGYGVMNLLMTSTPLAMEARGMGFGQTAQVIQWHIFAMFAPSFFTGHLVRKLGDLSIIFAGLIALLASISVTFVFGESFAAFCAELILLGIGWNFTFLGGTTLLTTVYEPSEKAMVQGFNDLCVFAVVTFTALMSGVLHHCWGWFVLSGGAVAPILVAMLLVLRVRGKSDPTGKKGTLSEAGQI